jgi:hypothetical protein
MIEIPLGNAVEARWNSGFTKVNVVAHLKRLDPKEVYCVIINIHQKLETEWFEKQTDLEILYKSPMCVNANPGHGEQPRNTFIVFRKKEEQPVPEVPVKRARLPRRQPSSL